ncbi:MAG: hypothetical protein ACRBCJ_06310 [Hyphomicrobiaceae bacterium]
MSTTAPLPLAAGQCWTYRTPNGFEASRLIIGAIVRFQDGQNIVCASATHTPARHNEVDQNAKSIAFIPMSEAAFRASVISCESTHIEPINPQTFQNELNSWHNDPKGMTVFTVPFEGSLDRMIASQMAQIVGQPAA